MPSPLESKHIAPIYRAIQELEILFPQGAARLHYDDGVHITSEHFCATLTLRQKDFIRKICADFTQESTQSTLTDSMLDSARDVIQDFTQGVARDSVLLGLSAIALRLKGWRKGAFFLHALNTAGTPQAMLHIDSEWQSHIKWNLLAPHFAPLLRQGIRIADIGCNNGFYAMAMWAMAQGAYKRSQTQHKSVSDVEIVGFDPSALFYCQFHFINHLINTPITYELAGVQDVPDYTRKVRKKFDVIFCLGVLYHRSDVFATLKALAQSLEKGGVAFIDTLIFDVSDVVDSKAAQALSQLDIALSVRGSYAKMSNVYLLPSLSTLEGWCLKCGFSDVELIDIVPTTTQEQRKTRWIDSLSLESFLNPNDTTKTIEGYPAPKRAYIKARRA